MTQRLPAGSLLSYPATKGFRMRRIRAVTIVACVSVLAIAFSVIFWNTKPAAEQQNVTTAEAAEPVLLQPSPPETTTTTTTAPTPTTAAQKPRKAVGATKAQSAPPEAVDPSRGDVWYRLRICESGNNYQANTGNGYYGAYQFSASTWRSMGTGYDYAHQAPPSVQDDAARRLQARSGWGQWPACSRKIGAR